MSANFIHQLNQSDSRLHKEDVLEKAMLLVHLGGTEAVNLFKGLHACYNPFLTFGVKQIPATKNITNAENPWDEFFDLLSTLAGRTLTGNAAREAIETISERFDSEEWNTFLAPILRRDMRAGISDKTINKIAKKTDYEIPLFECQLATSIEGRPELEGLHRLEPKADGVRVLMLVQPQLVTYGGITKTFHNHIVSYSRNGKVFDNFTQVESQIEDCISTMIASVNNAYGLQGGFFLDGEIVSTTFNSLMTQARRKKNVAADDSIYEVFDIIPVADFRRGYWNAPLHRRNALLSKMSEVFDKMPNVNVLPHVLVDLNTAEGKQRMHDYATEQVELGREGIMVKPVDAPYACTRSMNWMKWKPTITVDLKIIGAEEGRGKNAGSLGALICAGEDSGKQIQVNVGSGYTEQFRAQMWADFTGKPVSWKKKEKGLVLHTLEQPSGINHTGKTVEILADAVSQNKNGTYSLRFPRFVRFRPDKD